MNKVNWAVNQLFDTSVTAGTFRLLLTPGSLHTLTVGIWFEIMIWSRRFSPENPLFKWSYFPKLWCSSSKCELVNW